MKERGEGVRESERRRKGLQSGEGKNSKKDRENVENSTESLTRIVNRQKTNL